MKKRNLLLMLLLAIGLPWVAMAQQTLTVCDGTDNSEYVPFEGYNADAAQHNQMIFPATDLTAMNGKVITQMVFYIDQSASNGSNTSASRLGTWTVSLGETTATTLSGLDNTTTLTQVYQGYFDCSSGTLTLPFTDGYTYHGGNLLVDLNHAAASWNRWYFLGVNQSGVTAITRGSNYQFLPKTSFTYETPPTCPKPIGLTCSAYTANTATLSWTENGEATQWELEYSTDNTFATGVQSVNVSNTPSKQLTGLTAETTYYARVKADCGDGDQSVWSNTCEFKPSAYTIIGTGTSTTSSAPLMGSYNNSYDQMIYTASQLGLEASEITNIGFNSSAANDNPRTITIYMGHTTKSSFTNSSDFVSINDLTEVYSGTWNITAGWNEFELTTPFDYDGSSNLVIALYSKGSWSTTYFYYTATSSNQVVYAYSDSNDPNPNTYEGNWGNFSNRGLKTELPNLKLLAVASATPKPRNLVVSNITTEGATVTWEAPADNVTGYQYQYKYATTPTWPDTWNSLAANVTHKDLVALAANTLYDFRVRANYAEGDSDPAEIQFTTEATCLPPTGLHVASLTATSVTIAWDAEEDASYQVYFPGGQPTNPFDPTTPPENSMDDWGWNTQPETGGTASWNNLTPQSHYGVWVRRYCGPNEFSDPISIEFDTPCGTYDIPYVYGFEDAAPFECWTVIAGAAIQNYSEQAHESTCALKFSGTTNNMVALPQFVNATNTLRLEFWTRPENATNSSCGNFAVGYMTDLADANSFVAVKTYAYNDWTSAVFEKKTVDFANAPENAYIAMRQYNNSSSWYWFVDDVTVKEIPSCLAPSALAADASTTSAELSWTANSGETAWTLYWKKTTDENYTEVANATNPYTLEDLTPATDYQFYVVANCSADDASEPSEVFTFGTSCANITSYPWSENFDSYSTATTNTAQFRDLPHCWNYINECTYSNYMYYPSMLSYEPSSYAHSGSNYMRFYSYYASWSDYDPQPQYAILPIMENLAGKEITLWVKGYDATSLFKVGLMTTLDASTFVEITNDDNPAISTSYQQFSYVIPANATANYVAIMIEAANSSHTSNGVYIDDITVKEMVTVDADEIVATNPGEGQMTWSQFVQHWNNGDHFTSTTFTLMDDITVSTMVGTSDKPFTGTFDGNSHTITVNLTATAADFTAPFRIIRNATIQNLKVDGTINDGGYKFCAGFAGDCYGNNIFTNCESAVTINATIEGDGTHGGFIARNYGGSSSSSSNLCTTVFNGCAFTGQLLGASTTQSAGFCGWSEYSSPNYAKTIFNNCLFAPREVTMSTTNSAAFARYRNASYVNFNNCYFMQDFNDGTNNTAQGKQAYTITGVDPVYVAFSGEHTLYNMSGIDAYTVGMIHGYTKLAGEGETVTLILDGAPGYEADHGTLVANGETYTLTMEAYDTQISGVDCPVPYNVAVPAANLTARSAQVTWNGGSDSYTLQYREVITAAVDVNDTYDFEDNTLQGWTTISNDSDNNAWSVYNNSSYAHESSYSVYARYTSSTAGGDANDWLISPQIPLGGTFSFYARRYQASYTDRFQVYVSTTGNNISDFTAISEVITPSTIYSKYEYDLSSYSGNGYVAIVYTAPNDQYYVYVDDITYTNHIDGEYGAWQTVNNAASPQALENLTPETTYQVKVSGTCAGVPTDYSDVVEFTTLATCPAPTELAVTDGSVTAHAATITWTENGEATTWIVEYADNADFTGALTETVEDNATYSFDELDGETTYYVRVKAHCGDEDESYYSNVVNFTTLVACQAPTVLTVTATTTTTATLSWTENGTATAWQICLNGDETNLIAANSNPFTLESLTAATSYTVKVRANCGGIDGESAWSNEVSFATECDAITTFPWMVDFESFTNETVPYCWDNSASTTSTLSGNPQRVWGVYTYGENKMIRMYNYFVQDGTALINTPDLALPANAECNLTFDYSHRASCGEFTVKISTDGGTTFTDLQSYNTSADTYDSSNPGTFVSAEAISLAAYAGQTVILQFFATADYGSGAIFVDNVTITPTFTKTIAAVGEEGWANGKGGYYFIASPVDEPVTPTADNGFIVGDYDLYNFSQATDGEGNEWINFKDETLGGYNLTNGKGYLYASKEGTTLTFTGTPGTNGTVTLDNYDGNARFKGWNLIGNPFAQDAYIDKTFYTLENGDTYTSNTPETPIHAMQGVLIIADEDETTVTFTTEAPATNDGKLNMNLRRDNKQLDNAILVFGGEQQLGKMTFRANSSKVYMPVEGKDYAITSVEGQVGEVPVSFKAENNGTYSLNFTSEEVSFSYLHLIDNMTGNDVNLLQTPSYTFDARTSDYESRFRLVFATGSSVDGDSFGFVNASGNFCIFGIEGEATVQVIDILGHVISSETFSGSYEKRINGAPGVYMVRLIQGNDVKVQKVVVR